jgi:hypothetical protein
MKNVLPDTRPLMFREPPPLPWSELKWFSFRDDEDEDEDLILASSGLNASRGVESVRPGEVL